MVKSDIISAAKANRLYWLGRYVCRVYLTLHQLNKCFDEMIDGEPENYADFWLKLDSSGRYKTDDEFTYGMLAVSMGQLQIFPQFGALCPEVCHRQCHTSS